MLVAVCLLLYSRLLPAVVSAIVRMELRMLRRATAVYSSKRQQQQQLLLLLLAATPLPHQHQHQQLQTLDHTKIHIIKISPISILCPRQ